MVEMIKLLSFLCYLSLSGCRKAWQESNALQASTHSTTLQNDVSAVSVSPKKNSDSVIKIARQLLSSFFFLPICLKGIENLMKERRTN